MTEPQDIDTRSRDTRFAEALPTAVRWSHALLAPRLRAGDAVVDATAGNGHDTVFLARQVLPGGRVFAFDVQAEAIEATRSQVARNQSRAETAAVTLIHAGHEEVGNRLPVELKGGIRAFMFNLGWLPGSDKTRITRTVTTLAALRAALDWLAEGGLITIVCYPGHEGGAAEAVAVEEWAGGLPANSFEAQKVAFLNFDGAPPRCVVVRKRTRLTARTSG
jgi:SAM-dependent methyltransferase